MSDLDHPMTELQQQVAAVWMAVLKVDSIDVHDDFFELGGQSLQAMRVSSELKQRYGIAVAAIAVFQALTVAKLAEHISSAATDAGFEYGSI